jgi:hypothetical protein
MSARTPSSQNVTLSGGGIGNSLGTKLIEISALTALIGSTTAEQLTLGVSLSSTTPPRMRLTNRIQPNRIAGQRASLGWE